MIVSIGQFQLKKRSLLPKFLLLSKQVYLQALESKGNINAELKNEGIKYFYSFTHWDNMEDMKNFVHTNFHLQALKETEKLCKKACFIYYESDEFVNFENAKAELKNNSNTRFITPN